MPDVSSGLKVLLMPCPSSAGSMGPVTKALGVARALRARGCRSRFVLGGELAALVVRNGFEVAPYPVPRPALTVEPIRHLADFVRWAGIAEPSYVAAGVEAELTAIRDWRPDVVFAECRPTAAISAPAMGVPLAAVVSWPVCPGFAANHQGTGQGLEGFNRELSRHGLLEVDNLAELVSLRADVKLAPTLPELEPELQALPGVEFVGHMLDSSSEEQEMPGWHPGWPTRPLVFVYPGVGAIPPELYLQVVPAAFEGLPFDVLCACGFHHQLRVLPPASESLRFERYVPLEAIIDRICLVIFHGGQNTMMTTLWHGLPSITFPGQHFERAYNATQLARLGASRLLPVHAFRPRRLREAVLETLNGAFASASQALGQKLRRCGGTEQAAEAVIAAAWRRGGGP